MTKLLYLNTVITCAALAASIVSVGTAAVTSFRNAELEAKVERLREAALNKQGVPSSGVIQNHSPAALANGYAPTPVYGNSNSAASISNGTLTLANGTYSNGTFANAVVTLPHDGSSTIWVDGQGRMHTGPRRPDGAIYHQVQDVYYDAHGKKLETASVTHVVDGDCNPGRRRQDLIASIHDDGHGNVSFTEVADNAPVGEMQINGTGQFISTRGSVARFLGGDNTWHDVPVITTPQPLVNAEAAPSSGVIRNHSPAALANGFSNLPLVTITTPIHCNDDNCGGAASYSLVQ